MPGTNTSKLNLLRIQETWQFGDEAFNRFIDDADNKLVGVAHLNSPAHWSTWEDNTAYVKEDIIRITNGKTHQYYQCIVGGISGATEPTNDVTGSIVTDGTVQWMVMSLSEPGANGGTIKIWLSGTYYNRGDAVLYGTSLYRCKTDHTSTSWGSDYIYWQEIYASIRLWKPSIYYFVDDSVVQDGVIYQCNTAHTSASTFSALEQANWDVISGVGGVKNWVSGVSYKIGQFVISDGILYRSIANHTSGSSFSSDVANWEPINANITEWTASSYYPLGSLVQSNNIIYKCINAHTASSVDFDSDRADWVIFHIPSAFIYNWATSIYYYDGQFVLYNNSLYRCNTSHTSSSDFGTDGSKWDIVYASLLQWVANKYYKVGSVVIYNNDIYSCITANTDTPNFVPANWVKLTSIVVNNWASGIKYENKELVFNDGILYRANTAHTSGLSFLSDIANWDVVYSSIPLWLASINYKVGTVVIYNSTIYRCITDNNDASFDASKWDKITSIRLDNWATSTKYALHEEVLYDGVIYRANVAHTSASSFSTDSSKWDIVYANIRTYANNTFYKAGSDVVYNGKLYRCIVEHTSNYANIDYYLMYHNTGIETLVNWAATFPVTYDLDLGSIERLRELSFKKSNSDGSAHIVDMDLYTSTDGVNYELVNSLRGNTAWNVSFSMDSTARYVRFVFINVWYGTTVQNYGVSDLMIYKQNSNWELLSGKESVIYSWQSNKDYSINDVVIYNNKLYRCIKNHISSSFPTDSINWESVTADIPDWKANISYSIGDIFVAESTIYKVLNNFTSGAAFVETSDIEALLGEPLTSAEIATMFI